MSEEILINVTPRETRVAVVENGVLQEVFIERAQASRPGWQDLPGQGLPGVAGYAGGLRRYRAGAGCLFACLGCPCHAVLTRMPSGNAEC